MLGEHPVASGAPSAEAARIYRRICILRASHRAAEAERLTETDYAAALADAQQAPDAPADFPAWRHQLEATTAAWVDDALAFSELLAPLVAEHLRGLLPVPAGAASPTPSTPPVRSRSAAIPDIADFIETMLEQERSAATAR